MKNGQKFLGLFNDKIESDTEIPILFSSSRVHFGQKFLGKLPKQVSIVTCSLLTIYSKAFDISCMTNCFPHWNLGIINTMYNT